MLKIDEDAVVCDLAETYHVLDYRSLPASLVATFCVGLGEDSRIKRKMRGEKVPFDRLLNAKIYDMLALLVWFQTKDGEKGQNRPESLVTILLDDREEADKDKYMSFETIDDYEAFMKEKRGKWQT